MDATQTIAIATVLVTAVIGAITVLVTWLIGKQNTQVAERQLFLQLVEKRSIWLVEVREFALRVVAEKIEVPLHPNVEAALEDHTSIRELWARSSQASWLFNAKVAEVTTRLVEQLSRLQRKRAEAWKPLGGQAMNDLRDECHELSNRIFRDLTELDVRLGEYLYVGDIKVPLLATKTTWRQKLAMMRTRRPPSK